VISHNFKEPNSTDRLYKICVTEPWQKTLVKRSFSQLTTKYITNLNITDIRVTD